MTSGIASDCRCCLSPASVDDPNAKVIKPPNKGFTKSLKTVDFPDPAPPTSQA